VGSAWLSCGNVPKAIGGRLEIESTPLGGTQIDCEDARVSDPAQAAGTDASCRRRAPRALRKINAEGTAWSLVRRFLREQTRVARPGIPARRP